MTLLLDSDEVLLQRPSQPLISMWGGGSKRPGQVITTGLSVPPDCRRQTFRTQIPPLWNHTKVEVQTELVGTGREGEVGGGWFPLPNEPTLCHLFLQHKAAFTDRRT